LQGPPPLLLLLLLLLLPLLLPIVNGMPSSPQAAVSPC
jgi:hypothetical protein